MLMHGRKRENIFTVLFLLPSPRPSGHSVPPKVSLLVWSDTETNNDLIKDSIYFLFSLNALLELHSSRLNDEVMRSPSGNCSTVVNANRCCYSPCVCFNKQSSVTRTRVSSRPGIKNGEVGKCQWSSSNAHALNCCDCFGNRRWLPIIARLIVSWPRLPFRPIGSAKIPLRDLASGQAKSLPSRNVPLMNEKQQAVGVRRTLCNADFEFTRTLTKRVDTSAGFDLTYSQRN